MKKIPLLAGLLVMTADELPKFPSTRISTKASTTQRLQCLVCTCVLIFFTAVVINLVGKGQTSVHSTGAIKIKTLAEKEMLEDENTKTVVYEMPGDYFLFHANRLHTGRGATGQERIFISLLFYLSRLPRMKQGKDISVESFLEQSRQTDQEDRREDEQ